jgi:hypothetical protein
METKAVSTTTATPCLIKAALELLSAWASWLLEALSVWDVSSVGLVDIDVIIESVIICVVATTEGSSVVGEATVNVLAGANKMLAVEVLVVLFPETVAFEPAKINDAIIVVVVSAIEVEVPDMANVELAVEFLFVSLSGGGGVLEYGEGAKAVKEVPPDEEAPDMLK